MKEGSDTRSTLGSGLLAEGRSGSWGAVAARTGQGPGQRRAPQATPSPRLPWGQGRRSCGPWEHLWGRGPEAASRQS